MILERSERAGIGGGLRAKHLRPELHVVQTAANPPVVSIEGELDLATGPQVIEYIEALVGTDPTDVTLDLGQVRFIDVAGLSALLTVSTRVREAGGKFRLRAPSPSVVRLLALTGLKGELSAEATVSQCDGRRRQPSTSPYVGEQPPT